MFFFPRQRNKNPAIHACPSRINGIPHLQGNFKIPQFDFIGLVHGIILEHNIRQPVVNLHKILVAENLEQSAVGILVFRAGEILIEIVRLRFHYVGKIHSCSEAHTEILQEGVDLGHDKGRSEEKNKRKCQDFPNMM
jgi:hypothetical protein